MREDWELMQGAIDMHVHSAPSLFPRLVDHVEAAEGARAMGMKALVLKEHHGFTPLESPAIYGGDDIGRISIHYRKGGGVKAPSFLTGFTSDRIYFVRKLVSGMDLFGGVVLNNAVGGINPFAVDTAIRLGAKIVWFPTLSAKNHLDQMGGPEFGSSMKHREKVK